MLTLVLMVLLIAGGAFIADKIDFLKKSQWKAGILFGILAIVANTFSSDVYHMGISVGLIDAPPMIAGLLFGSLAGVIAGLIAAAGRALTPLWGVGETTWAICSAATLLISLYTAAFRNLVFDRQRPHIVPGVITVAFGEVLHLAFFYLGNLKDLSLTFEVIYASAEPMILGSSAAMTLSYFACWHHGTVIKKDRLNSPLRSFLVFGVSFLMLARISMSGAEARVDNALRDAVAQFDQKMSTIIELFMYRCAHHVMHTISDPMTCSVQQLKIGARDHGLDEANIITDAEKILASNREELINSPFTRSEKNSREFFQLLDGTEVVVKQGFRRGLSNKSDYSRYLGIAFPGRKAFLEVGYSFQRLERELEIFFLPAIANAPVYYTGYFLVVDENGYIVNDVRQHPDIKGMKVDQLGLSLNALKRQEKTLFFARVMGDLSRCMVDRRIGKLKVVALLPLKDVYYPMLRLLFLAGFALFCVCLLFRWTLVRAARNQRMLDELREQHEAQKERELVLARSVQISDLKIDPPQSDKYRIHAMMEPAREVGGDSYDYFEQPDGKIVFGICDVAGKGISAAIYMMKTRTSLRLLGVQQKNILELMESTNELLCRNNESMMFVTCWAGVYDPVTQDLEYVCAGHNPPFLIKASGEAQVLDCHKAVPLGIRPGYHYQPQKIHLEHGDQVFLYTDGVTEAMNETRQLYGEKRLQSTLEKGEKKNKHSLIEQVRHSLKKFVGETEQTDDITMLLMSIE